MNIFIGVVLGCERTWSGGCFFIISAKWTKWIGRNTTIVIRLCIGVCAMNSSIRQILDVKY